MVQVCALSSAVYFFCSPTDIINFVKSSPSCLANRLVHFARALTSIRFPTLPTFYDVFQIWRHGQTRRCSFLHKWKVHIVTFLKLYDVYRLCRSILCRLHAREMTLDFYFRSKILLLAVKELPLVGNVTRNNISDRQKAEPSTEIALKGSTVNWRVRRMYRNRQYPPHASALTAQQISASSSTAVTQRASSLIELPWCSHVLPATVNKVTSPADLRAYGNLPSESATVIPRCTTRHRSTWASATEAAISRMASRQYRHQWTGVLRFQIDINFWQTVHNWNNVWLLLHKSSI